ncbi:hypothetical protein [Absidia glauca]|uniref:Uncharacterized protein n=1 Tax=Absidia glauca TaxID=4829 RepID=A0A163LPP4_ABSGL|nr:hypothetical protein [Absidia glauca]
MYRTLQVNLTAAVKANRLAIQHFLREKKPGCIINTSSIYGFCGAPLAPMYSASKHAIIGLTKSYGSLLEPTNIRVNAVAPSFVGDVLTITSNSIGSAVESRPLDPLESKLVQLSKARQDSYRHRLLTYFQV